MRIPGEWAINRSLGETRQCLTALFATLFPMAVQFSPFWLFSSNIFDTAQSYIYSYVIFADMKIMTPNRGDGKWNRNVAHSLIFKEDIDLLSFLRNIVHIIFWNTRRQMMKMDPTAEQHEEMGMLAFIEQVWIFFIYSKIL